MVQNDFMGPIAHRQLLTVKFNRYENIKKISAETIKLLLFEAQIN